MITKLLGGSLLAMGALCLFLYVSLLGEQRHSAKLETRNVQAEAAHQKFADGVRLKAEQITRKAIENARAEEARQAQITKEVSSDYQDRIAALRRHYDALRLRPSGANPGSPGQDRVPGVPGAASGPNAAAEDYRYRAEADAIQLEELQRWIREQEGLHRERIEAGTAKTP